LIDRKLLSAANIQIIDLSCAAGETIYERGALAQFVYAVEEGALFRFRLLPGCRRSIQQFLFASDGFGYEIGRHHRDTVQALTDTKVLAAGRDALTAGGCIQCIIVELTFLSRGKCPTSCRKERRDSLRRNCDRENRAIPA